MAMLLKPVQNTGDGFTAMMSRVKVNNYFWQPPNLPKDMDHIPHTWVCLH